MKSYKRLFEAKKVGIIYHHTNRESFFKIIENDFKLKDIFKRGFISFTRIGIGVNFGTYRFVIDGDKLSDKYSIVPDSLAKDRGTGQITKNIDGTPRYKHYTKLQGEERIYKKEINIKNCILLIQCTDLDDWTKSEIQELNIKINPIKFELINKFKKY